MTSPLGIYVHIPFCAVRCGYCDFNTYVSTQGREGFAGAVALELEQARRQLGGRPADTVFIGGGTPSLLAPEELATILRAIELAPGAEVTSEANPESATRDWLEGARAAGINRISFGMQSAREHVLAALDRVHTPGRVADAIAEARAAGFERLSVDLIYGAHGETDSDWEASVRAALALEPEHVSAYALVVEPGTKLHARVRAGEVPAPDDDALARRYERADELLSAAGLQWYEISNWGEPCRHNIGYWRGYDWWGAGPGAHSHVEGTRWWNLKRPLAWAARVRAGASPAAGSERLDAETRRFERIMLGVRLAQGLDPGELDERARSEAERMRAEGLLEPDRAYLTLTRRGRLLADAVARRLTP
jgi:putative oxygen-independent coproporphyrinogen III oxidase